MLSRDEKIRFIKKVMAGKYTPADINQLKKGDSVVVVINDNYSPKTYHVQGTDNDFNEQQLEEYLQGIETVLYLPNNGH